jgi:hypothetical protein
MYERLALEQVKLFMAAGIQKHKGISKIQKVKYIWRIKIDSRMKMPFGEGHQTRIYKSVKIIHT